MEVRHRRREYLFKQSILKRILNGFSYNVHVKNKFLYEDLFKLLSINMYTELKFVFDKCLVLCHRSLTETYD